MYLVKLKKKNTHTKNKFNVTLIIIFSGFQRDPNGKYSLACKGPALYLTGPYKISGRVLVLPIQGVGKSNITLVDPEISMTFDGKAIKRGNNEHLGIENAKLTFKVNR